MTKTFDLLTWLWCVLHRHLLGCICATCEATWSNRHGATERAWQKLRTTRVTLILELLTHLALFMFYVWSKLAIRAPAPERTHKKRRMTGVTLNSNDPFGHDLWLIDLEMRYDTSSHRGLYLPNIKQIGQIGTEPRTGDDKNMERLLWPSPFSHLTWNCACHNHCLR